MFSRVRIFAAVALLALPASATTLLKLDLPALTKMSASIVRGTVKSSQASWNRDHTRISTAIVISVRETWKGAPVSELTVMQEGGVVGDVGQLVHGTVVFKPGDEVVLFLEEHGPRFILTGMVQGVFRISGDTATQALEHDAFLIDPVTRQPVAPQTLSMRIDALAQQVHAALQTNSTSPAGTGTRVSP